ncbi:hypothetical Protein YC6258_00960 [Gynuella sunshinyii YC6258]|uniref:Uncharacterized protein n=1 Tax=Gynuella sunshinyii YC6258 TaxID=1445510 RepID=A0A0C5V0B4_9GAMM|nr:hypothetical Protein YC6258_00960 [Gynuella sunshinyii YC6258]
MATVFFGKSGEAIHIFPGNFHKLLFLKGVMLNFFACRQMATIYFAQ